MAVLSGLRSAREDYLLYLVSTYLGRHRGVIKSPLLDSVHVCLIYTIEGFFKWGLRNNF